MNLHRLSLTAMSLLFLMVGDSCIYAQAKNKPELPQYSAAVFHYYNETGIDNMDVLQYSLREKLFRQLRSYRNISLIDQITINERILDRDLDIRNNLQRPRIMQYIGGLVNADIIIFGTYTVDQEVIVVSTHLVDATEGKQIRNYKFSGQISQIDTIVQRIASEIINDIGTWKQMGGFTGSENMAHHLGKLVAQADVEVTDSQTVQEQNKMKFAIKSSSIISGIHGLLRAQTYSAGFIMDEILAAMNKMPSASWFGRTAGDLYYMQAVAALSKNDVQQAGEHFDAALVFLSDNDAVLCSIAGSYASMAVYPKAIETYTKCIQKNPENIDAYVGIANVYMQKEEYVLAIFFLSQAVVKDPKNRQLYVMLAETYALSNRYEKAISTLQTGLKECPNDQEMSRLLAAYYRHLNPNYPKFNQDEPYLNTE